jgi:uncharacterized protein (DUF2062 family)
MKPWIKWTLLVIAAPFAAAAFLGLIFLGPIGWAILLVLAIYDIVAIRERSKERRHRELLAAMEAENIATFMGTKRKR